MNVARAKKLEPDWSHPTLSTELEIVGVRGTGGTVEACTKLMVTVPGLLMLAPLVPDIVKEMVAAPAVLVPLLPCWETA